jgi:hypothetical protein
MINSTKEWHWQDRIHQTIDESLEEQLKGWGFDVGALRESEGVSPLSTKSPRANIKRLIKEISSRL